MVTEHEDLIVDPNPIIPDYRYSHRSGY
jgi:hypothetical protein